LKLVLLHDLKIIVDVKPKLKSNMKNLFKNFSLAILAVVFLACSKKSDHVEPTSATTTPTEEVSIKNGRMVFADVSNYETIVVDKTKRESTLRSTRTANFLALGSDSSKAELYNSEFLQRILNQDGIVQIKNWIIKVDLEKELCYVLDEKYESDYQDLLAGNAANKNIQVYSTDEDVLELLMNNQSSARASGLFCKDRQATSKKDDGYAYINVDNTMRLDSKVVYQKAGIYFSLQGKVKAQEKVVGIWVAKGLDMRLDYDYRLNVRCGYYDAGANVIRQSTNEINYRAYENIRGLKNYRYTIRTNVYDNNVPVVLTRQYTIAD
jgi:hypothetical protein